MTELATIPEFSLSRWRQQPTQALAEELCTACHEVGFFILIDHGISSDFVEQVFAAAKVFFELPVAQRNQINKLESRHFRGWEAQGSEYTNGRPDIREQIDLWSEHPARGETIKPDYLRLLGPNQWPSEQLVPGFKVLLQRWFIELGDVADELMRILAQGLGLSPNYFDTAFGEERMSLTKLIQYPATPTGQYGVNAHHDAAFLTLLAPGTTAGLQIETAQGEWADVPTVPGAFVVNLGEILQSMTGNYLLATPHRVVTCEPRQSAGYFHGPSLDMSLQPIELDPSFSKTVVSSPRHANAGFMARKAETDAGVGDMASEYRPSTYGEQLWNYFCRSYPGNVAKHYPEG